MLSIGPYVNPQLSNLPKHSFFGRTSLRSWRSLLWTVYQTPFM